MECFKCCGSLSCRVASWVEIVVNPAILSACLPSVLASSSISNFSVERRLEQLGFVFFFHGIDLLESAFDLCDRVIDHPFSPQEVSLVSRVINEITVVLTILSQF